MEKKRAKPVWSDVKASLMDFNQLSLIKLIQDLYTASKDNQAFLHTRLGLGEDPLETYKATISRWICPAPERYHTFSVAKAKKAISEYKKALGRPEGMAELCVFYCEEAIFFLNQCGMDDESFYMALARMFEQAVKVTMTLPEPLHTDYIDRLDIIRIDSQRFGWGVGDDVDEIWAAAGLAVVR